MCFEKAKVDSFLRIAYWEVGGMDLFFFFRFFFSRHTQQNLLGGDFYLPDVVPHFLYFLRKHKRAVRK